MINHELAHELRRNPENNQTLKLSKTDAFIVTAIMGFVDALFYWTQKEFLWQSIIKNIC